MTKKYIVFLLFLFLSHYSFGQFTPPQKRVFNIAPVISFYSPKFFPQVGLDLSLKGTTLKQYVFYNFSKPSYFQYSVGLQQEFIKLSKVFYNLYWVGNAYYHNISDYGQFHPLFYFPKNDNGYLTSGHGVSVATGIKSYFAKRFFSNVLLGFHHEKLGTQGQADIEKNVIFVEVSIGVNIFKTYPKPKEEEERE